MEIPHRVSYAKCGEKVKSLLEDLNNDELTKRVEAIKKLGNLLCDDPRTRDFFHKLEGKNAILNRLFIEEKRKFVEAALFTLANSTINHVENQNSLINEYVFDLLKTIIKQSNIMELQNFSHGTIYLISTIVYQNSAGQHLVRESGCLNQLLNLFHKVLSTAWKIQNPDKELKNLDIICHTLYLSVNNPKNEENQKLVAVVFPKALICMSFLIFDNKMSNDRILPCLRLFTGTLSGNEVTQETFLEHGGMIFLRRLLLDKVNILEEESIEMCIILMDLLIASKRFPSSELPSPSIITFLVNVLQRHKCKLVTLFLLFHLMENDIKMQEVFIKCDGPEKMKQVCLKEVENEEIDLISSGIWAMILKNNLELPKAYVSPEPSKMEKDLEDEIKRNREGSEENSCRRESPKSSETSSLHTFDMSKIFDKRLPKTYKKIQKNSELHKIHENKSLVSSLRKNITVGLKSELDESQAQKVSPKFHIKTGIKRKQESPCVASEIDEGISDGCDDIQVLNISSINNIKAGIKRSLEIPYVDSEIGERMRHDPDAIQTTNLSSVDNIKAGIKRSLEIPCVVSEIGERTRHDPDAIQTTNLSAANNVKAGLKGRLEIPCVTSEISGRMRDDPDAIQTTNLSSVDNIKAGIKGRLEFPCVTSEISGRMRHDPDAIQTTNLSAANNVKAGIKGRLEIPCVTSEISGRMRDDPDAIQTTRISPVDNIKANIKRRLEIPCMASETGKGIRDDPDATQFTNLSSADNITVGVKRKLGIPCEDLEIVEEIKDEFHAQQTSKVSPTNNMFGITRKMITPCRDSEINRMTGDACIENDCRPVAPPVLNGLIVTPNRENCNYSYRYTDQLQSEHKSHKILASDLHNIPLQVASFARNINLEILKTPVGYQIHLHSNRNNDFCNAVKRSRAHGCNSQISHTKLLCNDSDIHYAIQDEAVVFSEKVKATEKYEIGIVDHKSNFTETSKPEVIKSETQDSDDDSVVILSHKRKVNGYEILDCQKQYNVSSEKTIKMENKCILNTPAHENMEKNDKEVENGIFCPIISLASQEMNSEIGYWDESKCTIQNGASEHLIAVKEKLKDFKFKHAAEKTETCKISLELVKERSSNNKKELMIPRGQKQRWRTQKGSLPQIPFTRQEIENLNAGIKEFGLNFIDIRKNYSFLSTRTSRDLFVAWRDGLATEYQGNKKMIRLSSDDSCSSDE